MDLQNAREALGWTMAELDRRAKLPKGTTSDIESGRNGNPTLAVCHPLLAALKAGGLPGLKMESLFPADRVVAEAAEARE